MSVASSVVIQDNITDKMANVIESISDPTKNALVVTNPDGSNITSALQSIDYQISELVARLSFLASVRGIAADLRVTLLSGTVTTVSSVTNIAGIGGLNAAIQLNGTQNINATLSNYNNVL